MAKIIESNIESRTVNSYYSIWQIVLIGVVLGFLFWGLTSLIGRFTNSANIPGDVATILVAATGIIIMVRLFMVRPLIITIATAASLWGLAQWSNGLSWWEIIAWDILLYGLSYTLFSWISRYSRIVPVMVVVISIVVILRIATTL